MTTVQPQFEVAGVSSLNGSVGIGTTIPGSGYALDVWGEVRITSNLFVGGTTTTIDSITTVASNLVINNAVGTGPALSVSQAGTGSAYAVAEFFDSDVSTTVPALMVANGGLVGIGTTSPMSQLDIIGSLIARNGTYDNALSINPVAGAFGAIEAMNQANTVKHPVCLCPWGGNVGIGTTAPACALDVNGSIKAGPSGLPFQMAQITGTLPTSGQTINPAYPSGVNANNIIFLQGFASNGTNSWVPFNYNLSDTTWAVSVYTNPSNFVLTVEGANAANKTYYLTIIYTV